MKKNASLIFALAILISINIQRPVSAHSEPERESGATLCAPDVYLVDPGDCLPLGPSNYLAELSQIGLTIPPRPLASKRPDPSLPQLPYLYFHLDETLVPVLNGPAGVETGNAYMPG
ncbi:MAG: hypothetical protein IT315_07865, partial [Anaerolineales bacterium]|nr:hypothetical protein [Anaerolineales bacterium]